MSAKKDKRKFVGGYYKPYYILNTIFNTTLAFIIILFSLPVLCLIALIIKLQSDGPVFYKGSRLGFRKKTFQMYKFRTLVPNAEKLIGAELLSLRLNEHQQLETKYGRFLRETRLDELPQLFNLLKGDMDLVGPRPIRPKIYERYCKEIKDYDKRFLVKPGLIGFSQLFTTHSAPKRIRSFIDNKYAEKKQNIFWDISFIVYAIFVIFRNTIKKIGSFIGHTLIKSRLLRIYSEKRQLDRISIVEGNVWITQNDIRDVLNLSKLININEEALLVYSDEWIDSQSLKFKIETSYKSNRHNQLRKHTAYCKGDIFKRKEIRNGYKYQYVIQYKPSTALNEYKIDQYFLLNSIV